MKYEVIVLPRAKIQLYESALWWAEHRSRQQAADWLDGFEAALKSLAESADDQPVACESAAFPFVVRQLNYGLGNAKTHRAVFEIRGNKVLVFAIRHLAQQDLTIDDR
ncbi:MAG TPA: type II toxin-antitoxin system RelE/ParE family toxin [Pirellulaceae bacterium]|nr:type II toxin-antitoxin system RelE/ParE family toxin [Pirellulaceae bacterium]